MIFKNFLNLVNQAYDKRKALFEKKTHDYATEDCLSNFKRIAQLCSLLKIDVKTPEGTALFYTTMKLDRICNLLAKKEKPSNESIDDSLNDIQNYVDLLRGVLKEKE